MVESGCLRRIVGDDRDYLGKFFSQSSHSFFRHALGNERDYFDDSFLSAVDGERLDMACRADMCFDEIHLPECRHLGSDGGYHDRSPHPFTLGTPSRQSLDYILDSSSLSRFQCTDTQSDKRHNLVRL